MMTLRPAFLIFLASLTSASLGVSGAEKKEKIEGYAEWKKGTLLVVDGQRVRAGTTTKFTGKKDIGSVEAIPLGYEVEVEGVRLGDGSLLASRIDAKPNSAALFEADVLEATTAIEAQWLQGGSIYDVGEGGRRREIGKMVTSGPQVERVRGVMTRLLPPYVTDSQVRVHVVDTKDWNAMAMGNGAVWVFTGLLNEMDDDEVAVVLGHELAHYTHEHTRRTMKKAMWGQLVSAAALVAATQIDNRAVRESAMLGGAFAMLAWQNGYGRDLEDQADRVGLRYAYEGGFDVAKGPRVWGRFREKYGQPNAVSTFFFSDHSQASTRMKNLRIEIERNYPEAR
jgi:hypothetical protein